MSPPAKPKYRTTNRKDYNVSLKVRGSLHVWLDKGICWHGSASGKQGRSRKSCEAASQFCLTIKTLFNLALPRRCALRTVCSSWPAWTGKCMTLAL
jgi:hypothetical protein